MAHAAGFSFLSNCINQVANLMFSTMQVPGTEFLLVFAIEFQSCVRGSLCLWLWGVWVMQMPSQGLRLSQILLQ